MSKKTEDKFLCVPRERRVWIPTLRQTQTFPTTQDTTNKDRGLRRHWYFLVFALHLYLCSGTPPPILSLVSLPHTNYWCL